MNILHNLKGSIYVRRYFLLLANNSIRATTTDIRQIGSAREQSTSSTSDRNFLSDEEEARRKAERLLRPEQKGRIFRRGRVIFAVIATTFGLIFVIVMALRERETMEKKRAKLLEMRSFARGIIGGGWELLNEEGKLERSTDLAGNYVLLYFGFIHCPDICPEEMEKMAEVVDDLISDSEPFPIVPVFISVDPKRDTPARVKEYCQRFSPQMRGFTSASEEKIKELTKKYRAYYSRAPSPAGGGAPQPDDYLIDHSIIIYFLGPNGELIEHFGRDKTARQITQSIREMTGRTKYWWNLWGRIK